MFNVLKLYLLFFRLPTLVLGTPLFQSNVSPSPPPYTLLPLPVLEVGEALAVSPLHPLGWGCSQVLLYSSHSPSLPLLPRLRLL